jgi:hypothetical protein
MPSVDVLKLLLTLNGRPLEGIFLRQRITSRLPSLWPLLDKVGNLFDFLEALPGVLDMTPDAVLGYGLFFANEAIVGDDGPFAAYPDFASLPQSLQTATRESLANLREHAASRAQLPSTEEADNALLARAVAHVEAALAGSEPKQLSQLTYDPDKDDYCFDAFFVYQSALFAATIRVNRKTGQPRMDGDESLGVTDPAATDGETPRPPRLPEMHLWGGFAQRPPTSGASSEPDVPLRSISGADATDELLKTGKLENVKVAGDVTLLSSAVLPSVHLHNCHIDGHFRMPGISVAAVVSLLGVRATGFIDLRRISVEGLDIDDCTSSIILDLADARIRGIVSILGVEAPQIDAPRLRCVGGPIVIGRVTISGDVNLSDASTRGSVVFIENYVGGACRLTDMRVGGAIEIGRSARDGTFVKQDLDLSGSRVGGDVILEGVHIGGGVSMIMGNVAGMFRIGAPHGIAGYRDRDCTIAQDLSLAHCRIKGPLMLRGVQLHGSLRLELCRLGAVLVEGRLVGDSGGNTATLLPSIIGGWVQIVACEIRGQLKLSALCVDKNYGAQYAIEVLSSTIGQGVAFWDEQLAESRSADDVAAYLGPPAWIPRASRVGWRFEASTSPSARGGWPIVWGADSDQDSLEAGAVGARPGERISFRELRANLSAQHVNTQVGGDVRIAQCKSGGEFSLSNLHAPGRRLVLQGVTVNGSLLADWTGHRYTDAHASPAESWLQQYVGLLSTTAATLEADGVTVLGEARLTGLRLTGRRRDASRAQALRFASATVGGLRLADFYGDRGTQDVRSRASIEGDLDVSWSTIGHLVLDGRSLGVSHPGHDGKSPEQLNRFVAANATIRKLQMVDPPPGQIDLLDAHVTFWDFGNVEAEGLLEFFHRVLNNQQPFRRNVYQEVEGYPHNIGHEDYAKDVRRELVARQHHEAFERAWQGRGSLSAVAKIVGASLKSVASRLNRILTGNLTSEWRPLLCGWLPLWLLAALYFANPARIAVAAENETGAAQQIASACATLGNWSFWDSLHFSTRYVLPIVPSVGMEDLSAADQLQTHRSCPAITARSSSKTWLDWLRPSTFATIVRILSWLFLSLVTGTIFAKLSRVPRTSR